MPRRRKGKLLIVSAPSGAGKTTLCHRLLADFPAQLVFSISCTTRKPRSNEASGRDYDFLSETEFKRRIKAREFAEWAEVHGHYYGTLKSRLREATDKGLSVVLDIDVQGAESLSQAFPRQCVSVFVTPPSLAELARRLKSRATDDPQIIQTRILNAEREMERSKDFDFVIINDDLDRAYDKLKAIVMRDVFGSETATTRKSTSRERRAGRNGSRQPRRPHEQ